MARICEPSPSTKRPPEADCKSQLALATGIGLRENAIAIPVQRASRDVFTAAIPSERNGSCRFSEVTTPS